MLRLVVLSCALLAAIGCGSDGGVELNEEALMEPTSDEMKTEAPEQYAVTFEVIVTNGFYNEQRFFRVAPGFVVQWGMSGDPEITKQWANAHFSTIQLKRATRVGASPCCNKSSQQPNDSGFYQLGDNTNLDGMRFAPFGEVTEGMDVVDKINAEHGQEASQGYIAERGTPICRKRSQYGLHQIASTEYERMRI